jgi:hypothetical protein
MPRRSMRVSAVCSTPTVAASSLKEMSVSTGTLLARSKCAISFKYTSKLCYLELELLSLLRVLVRTSWLKSKSRGPWSRSLSSWVACRTITRACSNSGLKLSSVGPSASNDGYGRRCSAKKLSIRAVCSDTMAANSAMRLWEDMMENSNANRSRIIAPGSKNVNVENVSV